MTRFMTLILALLLSTQLACSGGDDDDASSSGDDDTQATTPPGDDDDATGDDDDATGDDDDATGDDTPGDDDDATGDDDDTAPVDADEDGSPAAEDCDDGDPEVHPGAEEVCDEKDNDCDEWIDGEDAVDATRWYPDEDGDGWGDAEDVGIVSCTGPEGYLEDHTDCDDASEAVHPDAEEVCDTVDNDCDDEIDEGVTLPFYVDADGDGFGLDDASIPACTAPEGYAADPGDCDDDDPDVHPEAEEICNDRDDDCDDAADEGLETSTWYRDQDGDDFGDPDESLEDCAQPEGYVADSSDCDDTATPINPAAEEICNSRDEDCDDEIDEGVLLTFYYDGDEDGYGQTASSTRACMAPADHAAASGDCDDADPSIHPNAAETCDGIDDDCDGVPDDGVARAYYRDADGDGHGDPDAPMAACSQPAGYITDATDCNDRQAWVRPGALEACNEVDDDCDGVVDDGVDQPGCGRTTLLITEVSNIGDGREFIEIYNPTDKAVALHRYYLTDLSNLVQANQMPDNAFVNVVNGNVMGVSFDYLVRFPEGSQIAPGELIVVAVHKEGADGQPVPLDPALEPDFEIADTSTLPNMVPSGGTRIDKRNVGLSNDREFVLLFYWDGFSSLVQDVDYFAWSESALVGIDRTGLSITGPSGAATYRADTPISSQPGFIGDYSGASFCRKDFTEGGEVASGGNGLDGSDETGEDLAATWVMCSSISPGALE